MSAISSVLREDEGELDLLAKDLLINVTGFFRDAKVFEPLAKTIIPDLVRDDQPPIALCASGSRPAARARRPIRWPCSPRGDRRSQTQYQAAGVRLRRRAGCRRQRPRMAVPGIRSRRTCRPHASPASSSRRTRLQGRAGAARSGDLHGAGHAGRPPFSRLDMVSCRNLADLSAPRGTGEGYLPVPFRAARGRDSSSRRLGETRQHPRPFRAASESRTALSSYRPQPAGPISSSRSRRRGRSRPFLRKRSGLGSRRPSLADLCRRLVAGDLCPAAVLINSKCEGLYLFRIRSTTICGWPPAIQR